MACSTKSLPTVVPAREKMIAAAVASRRIVCSNCKWNKKGYCRIIMQKRGKEHAVIEDGIRRLSIACPDNRWHAVSSECVKCGRSIVVNDQTHVCKWCEAKARTGRQFRTGYRSREVLDEIVEFPFTAEPIRHLYFFLYPRFLHATRKHLSRLALLRPEFNGRMICCVAIGEDTVQNEVHQELERMFDEIIYVQNDPAQREAVGFVKGMEQLASVNRNEMICVAHGKGQQGHTHESGTIKKWNDAMYATCVANWRGAARAFHQGYPLAGSFKSVGNFATTPHKWHYSGAFFWVRSAYFFNNDNWRQMCQQWFAAESYVGRHFASHEGYALFGDNVEGGELYHEHKWKKWTRLLQEWKKQNEKRISNVIHWRDF